MKTPTIKLTTIDDKGNEIVSEYKARKPKVEIWRTLVKLGDSKNDQGSEEGMEEMMRFLVKVFKHPEVTTESLEEKMDLEDFFKSFEEVAQWIRFTVERKTGQIPNDQKEIVKN